MEDSSESESSPFRGRSSLVRFLNPLEDATSEHQGPQNYGSVNGLGFDGTVSGDLGDILEDEEMHATLSGTCDPSDDSDATDDSSFDEHEVEARLSELSDESFHLGGTTRMSHSNILVRERRTSSFIAHGDDYELVPTQLQNNVRMVEDVNLLHGGGGRLYLASYSLFNNGHDTKYAMTIQSDIYKRILNEVNEAHNVPCGLYFCCHGGDGAHTGVSHDDYVDIKLAWCVFLIIIGCLLAIEFMEESEV